MSEKDNSPADDARAKFLAALEKKKNKNKNSSLPGGGTTSGSKVSGSQTGGPAARFQRKSGPSGSAG